MMLSELKGAMTEKCLNRSIAETNNGEKERNKKAYIQASKLSRLRDLVLLKTRLTTGMPLELCPMLK